MSLDLHSWPDLSPATNATEHEAIAASGLTMAQQRPLAIVILARDEAEVIGRTVALARQACGPFDEVHVVADHCRDRTAEVARESGAIVHVRSGQKSLGKGAALRWWLERTRSEPHPPSGIVVLDADTLVEDGALALIRRSLSTGTPAVQAQVRPLLHTQTVLGRIAALSETVEQNIYDVLRSRLGWPVRLRGTGMGFQRWALEEVAPYLRTSAEDVELTIRFAALRYEIRSLAEAAVWDPKPDDEIGAIHQRARWLRGLLEVTSSCRGPILRVVALGPSGWSLLSSAMLKPRSLYFPLKVLLAALLWLVALGEAGAWWLLAAALTASSALELLGWLMGLVVAPERSQTLRSLLHAPRYAAMWLRSASLLRIAGRGWLRARPAPGEPIQRESAGAE